MATYGTTLTALGERLIASHLLEGGKLELAEIAVGDGGGQDYQPDPDMTELRRERWRGALNAVAIRPDMPNVIVIDAIIPNEAGGFTIREAGVFDREGNLIGIMNTPVIQKVTGGDGVTAEQYIQMLLAVSSTESIQLTVDSDLVMLTREELEAHNADEEAHQGLRGEMARRIAEHDESAEAHNNLQERLLAVEDVLFSIKSRVAILELMMNTNITENQFGYSFASLDELLIEGVWNATLHRIEF